MTKVLLALAIMTLGIAVGGGAAYGTARLLAGKPLVALESPKTFLPTGPITAPLVSADGRLSGYVQFEAQLEVPADNVADMRARLPLLLDAMTMRTFKTPMASGPDGMLPDIKAFRAVLKTAVHQVYGKDSIPIVITQALPI